MQITEPSDKQSNSQPLGILRAGVQILDDVMRSHGFSFTLKSANIGSGGAFAYGEYRRRRFRVFPVDRCLELHVRHSLGLVTYHVGKLSLVHEDYMWAAVGRRSATHYPGFSTDPLDGFRHLRADLLEHCGSFLTGPAAEFQELHSKALVLKKTARLP